MTGKTRVTEVQNLDAPGHVTGASMYVDDYPELEGTVYAMAYYSQSAHGIIRRLDFSEAEACHGIVKIIAAVDVPGINQIGGIVPDEPLLASQEVHYIGQPVLLIVADSMAFAHRARGLIQIEIEEKEVITHPRIAFEKASLLHNSRCFSMGDPEKGFAESTLIVEGQLEIAGQEHVYIEPQGAYAYPTENGGLKILSSTQGPTHAQKTLARVLDIPMHNIEVDVGRIGGGFGGKEDQATSWACMAGLASHLLNRPVKMILDRKDDLQMTGKRHPYSCDYKLGLDGDMQLMAYEATFYQNGGAAADLSPAVLERTLFHATNSYAIANVKVTAHCCKTNLPPNTAFRGFGGPQGMFVIEAALHDAARKLGVPAHEIQGRNLIEDGVEFPYGQIVDDCEARNCWEQAKSEFDLQKITAEVAEYNHRHLFSKKGIALMPVCFGISFTNTQMNQARALVHVYSDGSVGISTGAVEMGQGVNTKMVQVAARAFGIRTEDVKIETTNTTRVANTSPSAASSTADLNGKALQHACDQIIDRLIGLVRQTQSLSGNPEITFDAGQVVADNAQLGLSWNDLITLAITHRVNLSAKGHYATPVIHFDKNIEKGHPFAYHTYGTAIVVSRVDCILGTYTFDAVNIVHDCGASMNKAVDLGQIEGGLVQGMGWMTMEELAYADDGRMLSGSLATYKVPGVYSVPDQINVSFLKTPGSAHAILKSKAVGEPPLMYGIGAYFALYNAILAFNPSARIHYHPPMTAEKVLMSLYQRP